MSIIEWLAPQIASMIYERVLGDLTKNLDGIGFPEWDDVESDVQEWYLKLADDIIDLIEEEESLIEILSED